MIELLEKKDNIVEIIDQNHKDKTLSFFYFTASWCGPCKKIAPTIEKLSNKLIENNKNVKIYKIDIDENEEFALKCNIRSVPTFLIIDGPKLLSGCSGIDFKNISEMLIKVYNEYNSSIGEEAEVEEEDNSSIGEEEDNEEENNSYIEEEEEDNISSIEEEEEDNNSSIEEEEEENNSSIEEVESGGDKDNI